MTKNLIKKIFFMTLLMCFSAYGSAEDVLNTPNEIAAPRTSHLISYVMNAESASLIQKHDSTLRLILNNTHENVSYILLNKKKGLIETGDFIRLWKKSKNIQVDLTGVQVNNKIFGHTQFYATVLLKNPSYTANGLAFELTPVKPPIKMHDRKADLENVTLYVNGCDVIDCRHLSGKH